MERRVWVRSMLVALSGAALAAPAFAGSETAGAAPPAASSVSALALESFVPASEVMATNQAEGAGFARAPEGTRWEAVRYRPRRRYEPPPRRYDRNYGRRSETFSQIHGGFMDLEETKSTGVVFGFRGGVSVDPHIQIGANLDWRHKSDSATEVVSEGTAPGGEPIEIRRELARSSSNLFPLLGFLQVSGGSDLSVIPYLGVGAGYEVLFLSAEDFETGAEFDGTFGGFGWQLWGGAAIPLSGRARLAAEAFVNQAELSRDVEDEFGDQLRETVDMDGVGMRVGLSWGF